VAGAGAGRTRRAALAALLSGLLALIVYANALPNGLHVDDQQQIVDNAWIKDPSYLGEIFGSGVWEHAGRDSSYYRPMMYVLYMAVHGVSGIDPLGYHLLNVLLHVGCSVLVALLTWRVLDGRSPSKSKARSPFWASLLAGALFATHPIHTEPVAWAAGVADLSFSFFFLLALWLYSAEGRAGWLRLGASVAAYFLATLCKEPAITLPLVLVAYEWLLAPRLRGSRAWLRILPFLVAAGLYLALRDQALGAAPAGAPGEDLSAGRYVLTVLGLFSRYVEALVVPVGLNFWHVFRPPASALSLAAAWAALVAASVAAAFFWALRSDRRAAFALILLVVPLLPAFHVAALNQGIENAYAERYLYLPCFGYVLLLATLFDRALERRAAWAKPLAAAAGALVLLFAVGTVRRNPVWRDSFSLWSDAIRKSPDSAVVQMNYGFALMHRGQAERGRQHLRRAVELDPGRLDLIVQNGIAYARKGLNKQAMLEFNKALTIDPDRLEAHYNLAMVYAVVGWNEMAIRHYERTLDLEPRFAAAHNNLGILYARQGRQARARRHFESAVALEPANPDYRANLRQLEPGTGSKIPADPAPPR
jgi:tetratricopeptide (TPR) repeat protein